jgi:hypothetical protein
LSIAVVLSSLTLNLCNQGSCGLPSLDIVTKLEVYGDK